MIGLKFERIKKKSKKEKDTQGVSIRDVIINPLSNSASYLGKD